MNDIVTVPQAALRAELVRKLAPKYATRLFQLRDIPGVMRSRLGWPVASNLMERWFNGAAYQITPEVKASAEGQRLSQIPSSQLAEDLVSMQWALGFARVRDAMARLQANWASPAGLAMLKRRVGDQLFVQQCWRLGNLALPAKVLENTCQVNFLVFGQWSDPMDDFYGAMGEAQLKVAVSGMVSSSGQGRVTVEIDELGFYLRDAYDFNDSRSFISQPLGCWGFNGMECGIRTRLNVPIEEVTVDEAPSSVQRYKYIVQNQDFRRWREKHHRGGDFMVLSNVHRIKLPFPQKFSW